MPRRSSPVCLSFLSFAFAASAARLAGIAVLMLVALVASASHTLAQGAPPPPDLDAYVARVMKEFQVPGIGLAIVKDGQVILQKGYGVRTLGQPDAVTDRTLFGIASNSKVFTATALALLVEEGKIEWDAPVQRYLPAFQMWDPYVTRELTVRDLLVHRSGLGLGAGDLLWWPPSTYDRPEVVRRLRYIRPATSFRSAYAYDNVLYLVAGELIQAVSGRSWEQFVRERVLTKVGMTGSHPRFDDGPADLLATPHALLDGHLRVVKPFASDNTNPAGGIISSARDMARWVQVLLNEGTLADGARLFSEASARELTTLVTPMRVGRPPKELAALQSNFRGYALGLNVHDYRGRLVVTHTGGLPGFVSKVTLLPELELGIVVLTNQESGEAFSSLTWQIADHYLSAPKTDWVAGYQQVRARGRAEAQATAQKAAAARDTASKPSLPLAKYAGTYADAWYGDVAITDENGRLTLRFTKTPALIGDLEHFQYDTFIVRWRDRELRADAYVIFALDADGSIDQVKMRAVSAETDFSFDFHDLLLHPAKSGAGGTSRD